MKAFTIIGHWQKISWGGLYETYTYDVAAHCHLILRYGRADGNLDLVQR
jgi:hypothetical protein